MAAGSQTEINGLIEKALEIAGRRAETLGKLKTALLTGDDFNALKLAREYCGIEDEQVLRTDSRIN